MNCHLTLRSQKSLRSLWMLLSAMFVATVLTSCDPDDDGFYYYDITGRWIQIAPDYGPIYDFYGDGTGMCYDDYYGDSYFEWEANNNSLYLYFTDGYNYSEEDYNWSFQGNTLYLYPLYDYSNPLVLQPY